MRMEVHKHEQVLVLLDMLHNQLLSCEDCGVLCLLRVQIEPVQIQTESVKSVVASAHAVWIQNGNDFEHKIPAQESTLFTLETTHMKLGDDLLTQLIS